MSAEIELSLEDTLYYGQILTIAQCYYKYKNMPTTGNLVNIRIEKFCEKLSDILEVDVADFIGTLSTRLPRLYNALVNKSTHAEYFDDYTDAMYRCMPLSGIRSWVCSTDGNFDHISGIKLGSKVRFAICFRCNHPHLTIFSVEKFTNRNFNDKELMSIIDTTISKINERTAVNSVHVSTAGVFRKVKNNISAITNLYIDVIFNDL